MTEDPKKYLKEGERIDSVQRDGLSIIQDPSKFCFGMDAVLLSAFVKKRCRISADKNGGAKKWD